MKLNVISQNVMCWQAEHNSYEERRVLLQKVFNNHGADLIGIQEATPTWKKYFDEDLRDFDGILKYRGEESREAVPIYWRRDRFEKIDGGWFWLSETPDMESRGWGAACLRITTWACLEEKETGGRFAFVNTHLDHVSEEARVNGIKLIVSFIAERFGADMPLILTGDFNTEPGSTTISITKELLSDTRDIADSANLGYTFNDIRNGEKMTIDYVFVSEQFKCSRMDIIDETVGKTRQSDHYAVIAELEL